MDEKEMLEQTNPDIEEEILLELEDELDDSENPEEKTEENTKENSEGASAEQKTSVQEEEMYPEEFVVYGEKVRVPQKDVKALIQKGLAYDRAKASWEAKLNRALQDPRLSFVDDLAQNSGTDAVNFMSGIKMRNQLAPLVEQYGSIEDIPENILNMYSENARIKREKEQAELEKMKKAQTEDRQREEFYSFLEKHPDIAEIPQDVVKLVSEGMPLEGAWAIIKLNEALKENSSLKEENEILKQNSKNKSKATAAAESTAVKDSGIWSWE